ncbi:hypothetical protein D3C87_1458920 [compost metagenome]
MPRPKAVFTCSHIPLKYPAMPSQAARSVVMGLQLASAFVVAVTALSNVALTLPHRPEKNVLIGPQYW